MSEQPANTPRKNELSPDRLIHKLRMVLEMAESNPNFELAANPEYPNNKRKVELVTTQGEHLTIDYNTGKVLVDTPVGLITITPENIIHSSSSPNSGATALPSKEHVWELLDTELKRFAIDLNTTTLDFFRAASITTDIPYENQRQAYQEEIDLEQYGTKETNEAAWNALIKRIKKEGFLYIKDIRRQIAGIPNFALYIDKHRAQKDEEKFVETMIAARYAVTSRQTRESLLTELDDLAKQAAQREYDNFFSLDAFRTAYLLTPSDTTYWNVKLAFLATLPDRLSSPERAYLEMLTKYLDLPSKAYVKMYRQSLLRILPEAFLMNVKFVEAQLEAASTGTMEHNRLTLDLNLMIDLDSPWCRFTEMSELLKQFQGELPDNIKHTIKEILPYLIGIDEMGKKEIIEEMDKKESEQLNSQSPAIDQFFREQLIHQLRMVLDITYSTHSSNYPPSTALTVMDSPEGLSDQNEAENFPFLTSKIAVKEKRFAKFKLRSTNEIITITYKPSQVLRDTASRNIYTLPDPELQQHALNNPQYRPSQAASIEITLPVAPYILTLSPQGLTSSGSEMDEGVLFQILETQLQRFGIRLDNVLSDFYSQRVQGPWHNNIKLCHPLLSDLESEQELEKRIGAVYGTPEQARDKWNKLIKNYRTRSDAFKSVTDLIEGIQLIQDFELFLDDMLRWPILDLSRPIMIATGYALLCRKTTNELMVQLARIAQEIAQEEYDTYFNLEKYKKSRPSDSRNAYDKAKRALGNTGNITKITNRFQGKLAYLNKSSEDIKQAYRKLLILYLPEAFFITLQFFLIESEKPGLIDTMSTWLTQQIGNMKTEAISLVDFLEKEKPELSLSTKESEDLEKAIQLIYQFAKLHN